MPADNSVNGVPSCANRWLLDTLARKEWRFDGYITSDCGADVDVWAHHNYTKTPEEAAAAILRAGQDIDCGGLVSQYAASALQQGLITEADIDTPVSNLFRVRFRLGHFDPKTPLESIPPSEICSAESVELAREIRRPAGGGHSPISLDSGPMR